MALLREGSMKEVNSLVRGRAIRVLYGGRTQARLHKVGRGGVEEESMSPY